MAFGFAVTVLSFAAPLYMMNVYERVLGSRNETTLVVMTVIVVFAMLLQSGLDAIRTDFLRRAAVRFDRAVAQDAFDAVQRAIVQRPLDRSLPSIRDVDVIRDFISSGALSGLMDAVWLPLFLIDAYILHPIFAAVVLIVALIVALLAYLTSRATAEPLREAQHSQQLASQRVIPPFRTTKQCTAWGCAMPFSGSGKLLTRMRWAGVSSPMTDPRS